MKLEMRWINQKTENVNGLVFVLPNIDAIFGSRQVAAHLAKMNPLALHNCNLGLEVSGFDFFEKYLALEPTTNQRGCLSLGTARHVYEYVNPARQDVSIYAGLTVHDTRGSWSSWPAHEFEVQAFCSPIMIFPNFNEKFAYITDPSDMWCLQVDVPASGDCEIRVFRDRDITNVPLGAHPSVAAPGVRLAYFWAYTGAWAKEY